MSDLALVAALQSAFERCGYVSGSELMTVLQLLHALGKPMLVEGEAGVG